MARRNPIANLQRCPRCGATAHMPGARFCSTCGLRLRGESGFAAAFWLIAIAAALVVLGWRLI
jgi:uncharacterized protein (DUF983 family)